MPKAPEEIQRRINEGEVEEGSGSSRLRKAAPEGYYLLRTVSGEEYEGREYDGVNMKYEVQAPAAWKGKWVWDRLSYNPDAAFRWKNLYDATGYTIDSDTNELVEAEELVVVFLSQQISQGGKSKGELVNQIDEYFEPSAENLTLVED